jgi:sperm-associated antigen 16 protein
MRTCVNFRASYDSGTFAVNSCAFDRSGTILAAGTDEGLVKLFNTQTNNLELTLKGHEDAVQDVAFDINSKSMITTGSDCSFIVWS